MGAIGGLLGTAGGASGSGFSAPVSTQVVNPTSAAQTGQSYQDVQNNMVNQRDLLRAIGAQNGLQNQSQNYNQLQGVINGTGPNPAQAMLSQATGANVANQAALMAGQRGSGANAGLMARQAAMQGANTQQQAIGQGATMQANQSLNALNSAGSMANNMASNQIGQTNANTQAMQAEQGQLFGAQQGVNSANVGMQSNVNSGNAGLANTNMQGQQGMIGGAMNAAGSIAGMMADGGEVDSGMQQFTPAAAKSGGGGAGGMAALLPLLAMAANGGTVRMADGGDPGTAYAGQSKFGAFLSGMAQPQAGQAPGPVDSMGATPGAQSLNTGMSNIGTGIAKSMKSSPKTGNYAGPDTIGDPTRMNAANGGTVPAMLSPGERYLPPKTAQAAAQGKANPIKDGKLVPGTPKVAGAKNSYANDIVPAKLEEGGIVIPRSVTMGKNPEKAAMDFVRAVLAKKKGL